MEATMRRNCKTKSLNAQARERGLKPGTVYMRVWRSGMSLRRALATPLGPSGANSITGHARLHGLRPETVHARLGRGMSLKQGLSTPVDLSTSYRQLKSVAAQARKHGLKPETVLARIRTGMSLRRALTTPLSPSGRRSGGNVKRSKQEKSNG
jgi:hypothetical protein